MQVRENYSIIKEQYNTIIYGISVDSPEDAREFQDKLNLPFSLLSDESKEVIDAYEVSDTVEKNGKIISLSANIVINQHREIVYYHKGHYKDRPSIEEMLKILKGL